MLDFKYRHSTMAMLAFKIIISYMFVPVTNNNPIHETPLNVISKMYDFTCLVMLCCPAVVYECLKDG